MLIDNNQHLSIKGECMANHQDLRFKRTNQLLCDAFIELLKKRKFEDITIQELCDKALVRRATFYTHFIDKYDFFTYFIKQNRDSFSNKWISSGNKNDFFLFMFQQTIQYVNDRMDLVNNILNSNAFPILLEILTDQIYEDVLLEFKDDKNLPIGVSAQTVAAFYSGGFIRILQKWITNKNKMSINQLNNEVKSFLKCINI
jgi:AcrR family transcriptional regulator